MAAHSSSSWNYPTPVHFGPGRIKELPDACQELGIQKPLIVTDPGIARLPILSAALEANKLANIPTGVFSEVQANPNGKNVWYPISPRGKPHKQRKANTKKFHIFYM